MLRGRDLGSEQLVEQDPDGPIPKPTIMPSQEHDDDHVSTFVVGVPGKRENKTPSVEEMSPAEPIRQVAG